MPEAQRAEVAAGVARSRRRTPGYEPDLAEVALDRERSRLADVDPLGGLGDRRGRRGRRRPSGRPWRRRNAAWATARRRVGRRWRIGPRPAAGAATRLRLRPERARDAATPESRTTGSPRASDAPASGASGRARRRGRRLDDHPRSADAVPGSAPGRPDASTRRSRSARSIQRTCRSMPGPRAPSSTRTYQTGSPDVPSMATHAGVRVEPPDVLRPHERGEQRQVCEVERDQRTGWDGAPSRGGRRPAA